MFAAIGVAGAVAWVAAAGKRTPPAAQLDAVVAELDTAVREAAAKVNARAAELGELHGLDWAIATDETTIRDLMTDEVAFRPQAGESIEIGQVRREGGEVRRLITLPADGRPILSTGKAGQRLVVDGDQIRVAAVVRVAPQGREEVESGLVGVARVLDVAALAGRFEALGSPARLQTAEKSVALGAAPWGAGPRGMNERALQSPVAAGVKVQFQQSIAWPHVIGAFSLLLASIVSALIWARRKRPSDLGHGEVPFLSPDETTAPSDLRQQEGNVLASRSGVLEPRDPLGDEEATDEHEAGTLVSSGSAMLASSALMSSTTLVDAGDGTLVPAPASRSGKDLDDTRPGAEPARSDIAKAPPPAVPRSTATIPAALFLAGLRPAVGRSTLPGVAAADGVAGDASSTSGAAAATPLLPDPNDPWAAEYRRLFREFVKMRRTCGESIDDLDKDKFIAALHKKRLELVQQNQGARVDFQIAFDNGKAAVRVKVLESQPVAAPVREGNGG